MRRLAAVLSGLALWLAAGALPAAAAEPKLGPAQLRQLRDIAAAVAPAGSVSYVDETGVLVMRIPGSSTPRLDSVIGRHGRQVRLERGAARVVTMAQVFGGTHMETAFQERACTVGFLTTGGVRYYLLTAGHCTQDGIGNTAIWYTRGGYNAGGLIGVGTILDAYPERDFGAVQVSLISPHQYGPYVLHNGSPKHITRARMPARNRVDPQPVICKTGRISGTTCGVMLNWDVTVTFHNRVISGLIETNVCAQEGDSGAPLFARDISFDDVTFKIHSDGHGILVGGNGVACGHPASRTYFYPLTDALAHYGLTLIV